jgi:hypothetical protein
MGSCSKRDADATDAAEVRYLIKGRRLMPHNNSRRLGALRDLPAQGFDVLAAVPFQADCRILRAQSRGRVGIGAERLSDSNVITLNHCVRMMVRDRA